MDIQHMIRNLINSADSETRARCSYMNLHAQGLHYLNLIRNERMTVKLYIFKDVRHNAQGYLVHPHNHGYNFSHQTIIGSIKNHKFQLVGGDEWDLYRYSTPLNGGSGPEYIWRCGLKSLGDSLYGVGHGYYLDSEEIHTISVHSRYAAAVLVQYHDVYPGEPTIMFAPHDELPDCENGLYIQMESWQFRDLLNEFLDKFGEQRV